jgi:hypothetical protein
VAQRPSADEVIRRDGSSPSSDRARRALRSPRS